MLEFYYSLGLYMYYTVGLNYPGYPCAPLYLVQC